ncbi:tetratricopeptide repeat protein [Alkaliphilus transvaalensis]|uniref:tetratricopeptide repeat protein n=1 Tax=Alkaliphilus transvaalensis TaxID=114628 RepID=UPI00047AD22A|nr:tetratricopeptide repeat protein [Alkaliphilus transvaalensis]
MEVLTPGERVKKLRVELGLTQDDLANEAVSKSLISMIEKNKRGLTPSVAKIIANKLNTYYEAMNRKITPEELMETEGQRVCREVKEEIKHLQSIIDSGKVDAKLIMPYFDKLLGITKEWDLTPEEMELIVLRGRLYYKTFQYVEALKDYSDALPYYLQVKDHYQVARIYNLMGTCNHMLMRIDQALNYYLKSYDTVIENNIENSERLIIESLANLVLSYRKLNQFDMALKYINLFKELGSAHSIYKKISDEILLAEGNTYRDIRNYEKATRIYDRLLSMEEDIDKNLLFLVYDNYATLYQEQGKDGAALACMEEALKMKDDIAPRYIPRGLLVQAKCQFILKKYDEAICTLNEGLILSKNLLDNEMIIKFQFALIQTFLENRDYNSVLYHLNNSETFMQQHDIKTEEKDLYSFYAEVYCRLGETDRAIEYISKTRTDYLAM